MIFRAEARKRSMPAPGRDEIVDASKTGFGGFEAGADTDSESFGGVVDPGS